MKRGSAFGCLSSDSAGQFRSTRSDLALQKHPSYYAYGRPTIGKVCIVREMGWSYAAIAVLMRLLCDPAVGSLTLAPTGFAFTRTWNQRFDWRSNRHYSMRSDSGWLGGLTLNKNTGRWVVATRVAFRRCSSTYRVRYLFLKLTR